MSIRLKFSYITNVLSNDMQRVSCFGGCSFIE